MRRCRSASLVIAPRRYQPLPPPSSVGRQTSPFGMCSHACEHIVPGLDPGWSAVHVDGPCPHGLTSLLVYALVPGRWAAAEVFSATAARMSAFNAFSSILSPS